MKKIGFAFCFYAICLLSTQAQFTNLKFENFSTEEGLSSSTCLDVFQDSEGYIWIGTIDGLSKFDGYTIEIFRPNPNDPNSLSNNRVNAIAEDGNGNLWIGTKNGLNIFNKSQGVFYQVDLGPTAISASYVINDIAYNPKHNSIWIATKNGVFRSILDEYDGEGYYGLNFTHYFNVNGQDESIDNNDVSRIAVEVDGNVWLSTRGDHINQFNFDHSNFIRYDRRSENLSQLDYIPIALMVDRDGNVWSGSSLSQLIILRKDGEFERLELDLGKIGIYDIFQDDDGYIWISTSSQGIYVLDSKGNMVAHIVNDKGDPFSIPNNQPSKIIQDKRGIIWIGTYNKGVVKLDQSKSAFGHYFYKEGMASGLSTRIGQAVLQDKNGRIWIGADGGGLNLFNEENGTFNHFRHDPHDPNTLSTDKILYMESSYDGSIWICTWDGGLNRFYPDGKQNIRYLYDSENPHSIGQNTVWCAQEDKYRNLWLGTQEAGLNIFNSATNSFEHHIRDVNDSSSLMSDFVFMIFIDSQDRVLIGTDLGLCWVSVDDYYQLKDEKLSFNRLNIPNISRGQINYITEDHNHHIWIGSDLGLHHLDEKLNYVKSYSVNDGLPNNLVIGIEEGSDNEYWITTKSGISHLTLSNEQFVNYNVNDGLQGAEFQSKSITRLQDGRILAGGINGFNLFHPNAVEEEAIQVNPQITKLKLLNESIFTGESYNGRVVLEKPLSESAEIQLNHDEGYITLEFAALYMKNPQKIKYAHKMHGIDQEFVLNASRIANYSGLQPGDYTFEVKASLHEDWDHANSASLSFKILPPPWKTWWAYLIYIALTSLIAWTVVKYYGKLIREEREHELDQMKLKFFVNVSHEFRTPLTLILNPVDKILSAFEDQEAVKSNALTIQRSARKLLNLVNQLLDFRKMDLGKAPLDPVKGDLGSFIKDMCKLFEDFAEHKQIIFDYSAIEVSTFVWFDPDKMEKIFNNLLSNALKYTSAGGEIKVLLSREQSSTGKFSELMQIVVADTGIGLKKEQQDAIFDRFFHLDNSKTGTGIGLNFTKSLVEQHDGIIEVESEFNKGSKFIVKLPIDSQNVRNALQSNKEMRKTIRDFDATSIGSLEYELSMVSDESKEEMIVPVNGSQQTVLIVEDNKELRVHLKNELNGYFRIKEASDGQEGLEKALKYYPDIIISDVMMPKMNGFEMCQTLKSQLDSCHIPIILLTAKSLEEDRIEGYNYGADAYLPKPFNIQVLRARIQNLLEIRRKLREKFMSQSSLLPSSEITTNTLDEKFLDDATNIILEHVSDSDFGLEMLINEIGVSRSHFYRKISSLTGQNPSNFIRTIRLKYAADLLRNRTGSIKEIAYKSGFNSTAYFSKTFRELFGTTPNEFAESESEKVA
ncbi:MAG: response regulator [Cyclobacteriaceae bacterium]